MKGAKKKKKKKKRLAYSRPRIAVDQGINLLVAHFYLDYSFLSLIQRAGAL